MVSLFRESLLGARRGTRPRYTLKTRMPSGLTSSRKLSAVDRNACCVAALYSATQHAFRSTADSLREEVNPDGIRVLSVYLGRVPRRAPRRLSRKRDTIY